MIRYDPPSCPTQQKGPHTRAFCLRQKRSRALRSAAEANGGDSRRRDSGSRP